MHYFNECPHKYGCTVCLCVHVCACVCVSVCADKSKRPGHPTVSGRKTVVRIKNTEKATITSALNMKWQN